MKAKTREVGKEMKWMLPERHWNKYIYDKKIGKIKDLEDN